MGPGCIIPRLNKKNWVKWCLYLLQVSTAVCSRHGCWCVYNNNHDSWWTYQVLATGEQKHGSVERMHCLHIPSNKTNILTQTISKHGQIILLGYKGILVFIFLLITSVLSTLLDLHVLFVTPLHSMCYIAFVSSQLTLKLSIYSKENSWLCLGPSTTYTQKKIAGYVWAQVQCCHFYIF